MEPKSPTVILNNTGPVPWRMNGLITVSDDFIRFCQNLSTTRSRG